MDYAPLENSVQVYTHYRAVFKIKNKKMRPKHMPWFCIRFNGVDVGNFEKRSLHFSVLKLE
jgi:hypothetical protein